MNVAIIGGGISGLTLASHLKCEYEVLEKETVTGGLCRTFWKDGFGYDIGGHILFSKHEHVNTLINSLLDDNINHQRRANKILYKGISVKYPFENDLAALPLEERYECLIDYLKADYPEPTNLEEWAYYTFGKSISEKYFLPYNAKIWNRDPRSISLEWVSRIPKPPMEDVVKSALGWETEGYTHQLNFRYPLHGGFQSVLDVLAGPNIKQRTGIKINHIGRNSKDSWTITHQDGIEKYDRVVLACPIHEAIKYFDGVPESVLEAIASLEYNSIRICLIGINNTSLNHLSAVYIPDPDVLANRVCFMGYFSPNMVPKGCSSAMCEVTTRPGDEVDQLSDKDFMDRCVEDMDRIGLLNKEDVVTTDCKRMHYAYPVYLTGYSAKTSHFREYFQSLGIELLGRFAEFDYINSDECVHRALEMAERLNQESKL